MQLSRIDFNSAFARLLRPREPEVVEREQPETAESPARAVAANRVTVPLVAFVGFLFLVLLLFVGTAVVGQANIRADERMIAAVSAPLATSLPNRSAPKPVSQGRLPRRGAGLTMHSLFRPRQRSAAMASSG